MRRVNVWKSCRRKSKFSCDVKKKDGETKDANTHNQRDPHPASMTSIGHESDREGDEIPDNEVEGCRQEHPGKFSHDLADDEREPTKHSTLRDGGEESCKQYKRKMVVSITTDLVLASLEEIPGVDHTRLKLDDESRSDCKKKRWSEQTSLSLLLSQSRSLWFWLTKHP